MAESSRCAVPNALHFQNDGFTQIDLVVRNCSAWSGSNVVVRCSSVDDANNNNGGRSIVDDAKALTSQPNGCKKEKKNKKRNHHHHHHHIWEGTETPLCPTVKRRRWSVVSNSDRSEMDNNNNISSISSSSCSNNNNIRNNEPKEMIPSRANVRKKIKNNNHENNNQECRRRVRFQLDAVGNVVRTFAMSSLPLSQTTADAVAVAVADESIELTKKKNDNYNNNNNQEEEDASQDQVKQQGHVSSASKRQPLVRNIKAIRQDVMDCFRHDGDTIGLYANVMLQTYLTCCNSNGDSNNTNNTNNNADVPAQEQQEEEEQDCDISRNKQACAITTNPASALCAFATTHSHTTATAPTRITTSSSSTATTSSTTPTTLTLIPPDHVAFLSLGRGQSRGLETHVLPVLARERKRRRLAHVQQIVLWHAQLSLAVAQAAPQSNHDDDIRIQQHPNNNNNNNLFRECHHQSIVKPHPAPMSSCEEVNDPCKPCSLSSSSPQSPLLLDTVASLLRAVSLQSSAPARQFAQIMGAADAADAWTEYISSLSLPLVWPDPDNDPTQPPALAPSSSSSLTLARENLMTADRRLTLAHMPSPSPPPPPVSSDEESSDDDDNNNNRASKQHRNTADECATKFE